MWNEVKLWMMMEETEGRTQAIYRKKRWQLNMPTNNMSGTIDAGEVQKVECLKNVFKICGSMLVWITSIKASSLLRHHKILNAPIAPGLIIGGAFHTRHSAIIREPMYNKHYRIRSLLNSRSFFFQSRPTAMGALLSE